MAVISFKGILSSVQAALLAQPNAPAVEVLDHTMHRFTGMQLDCSADPWLGFDNWLHPPSFFASLVRQALAPEITEAQTQLWTTADDFVRQGFREMWHDEVVARFAERYQVQIT